MQRLQHRTMMMTRRPNEKKTREFCFIHISLLDNRLKIKSLRPLKWIIAAESTIITCILITTDGFACKENMERNARQKNFFLDNHDE